MKHQRKSKDLESARIALGLTTGVNNLGDL